MDNDEELYLDIEVCLETINEKEIKSYPETDQNSLKAACELFSNSIPKTRLNNTGYSDRVQAGGRFAPAFPAATKEKEEAYIEKMLLLDKKRNNM
jgi:hypothetical protein